MHWTLSTRSLTICCMSLTHAMIWLAIASAPAMALAKDVNKCKQPDGRVIMTDRPCGDPATERHHKRPAQDAANEINAGEVFSARKKIGESARSPELIDSRGISPSPDQAPREAQGQD